VNALIVAHRILIGAAILLSVLLVIGSLARGQYLAAAGAAAAGVAAAIYLAHVLRKYAGRGREP
jgi:hypothetical protein